MKIVKRIWEKEFFFPEEQLDWKRCNACWQGLPQSLRLRRLVSACCIEREQQEPITVRSRISVRFSFLAASLRRYCCTSITINVDQRMAVTSIELKFIQLPLHTSPYILRPSPRMQYNWLYSTAIVCRTEQRRERFTHSNRRNAAPAHLVLVLFFSQKGDNGKEVAKTCT